MLSHGCNFGQVGGAVSYSGLIWLRCGAELVLRTAKKGPNAGNQFYGWDNFPKCRFVKDV